MRNKPSQRDATQRTSEGHPNAGLAHIVGDENPSSAVHIRYNDADPTGLITQFMVARAAGNMAGLTILALRIASNEEALAKMQPLIARLFPE